MNPLISFRSNSVGNLSPTPAQRQKSTKDVTSLFRAQLEGLQRAAKLALIASAANSAEKAATDTTVDEATKAASTAGSTTTKKPGELDKDAFLELMVKQMQYQDPLSPMDNSQMIAQLAQFSSLEQMNNLNKAFTTGLGNLNSRMDMLNLVSAQGLVGKQVIGKDSDGQTISGAVTGVHIDSGKVSLRLESGTELLLNNISSIGSVKTTAAST